MLEKREFAVKMAGQFIYVWCAKTEQKKEWNEHVYLGTEETGMKTLKDILLSKNDGEILGQKPKQPLRKTAEEWKK